MSQPLGTSLKEWGDQERATLAALEVADYAHAAECCLAAAAAAFEVALASCGSARQRNVQHGFALVELAEAMVDRVSVVARPVRATTEGPMSDEAEGSPWTAIEPPTVRLDDVAGLEEVKAEIRSKIVVPFEHPEILEEFQAHGGGGVLMYGPPGNGKTLIAKAIAGELGLPFFNVVLSQMKSKYVGDTEKNLHALFAAARRHPRAVIFLDEVDSLLAKRGHRFGGTVAQFLTLVDGLESEGGQLLLLAGTNRPWVLDPAVVRPGRLGTHVYVGLPDVDARRGMLELNLDRVPVSIELDLDDMARLTEGYSGAEIRELVERAKAPAIERRIAAQSQGSETRDSDDDQRVSRADFDYAFSRVKPLTDPADLARFADWGRGREEGTRCGE